MAEQRKKISVEKILHYCMKYGETRGIDTPAAIQEYIRARGGEVSKEQEKIEQLKRKIKRIERQKMFANEALTRFWIEESEGRKEK